MVTKQKLKKEKTKYNIIIDVSVVLSLLWGQSVLMLN